MQPMTAEGEASGTTRSKTSRIKFGDAFLAQIKVQPGALGAVGHGLGRRAGGADLLEQDL
jgi:hypothetical protein